MAFVLSTAVPPADLRVDRIVRRDCIEFVARELTGVVGELYGIPTADREDNMLGTVSGTDFPGFSSDALECPGHVS